MVSPSYFNGWSPEKKRVVREYFLDTFLKTAQQMPESPYLFLF